MIRDEGFERLSQFGCSGRAVARERNLAQSDDDFTDKRPVEIHTRGGKSGGGWRVSVNYPLDIGAQAVDQEVHSDLTGNIALTGKAIAFVVDDYEVGRLHPSLAHVGGSDQQAVVIEANGEVAIRRGNEAVAVQEAPKLHHCESMFSVAHYGPQAPRS